MTSTHESLVRRPLDEVRQQLRDPDRVLSALPGATLVRGDEGASGSLKLRLGTLQITYRVTVRATAPEGAHAATVAVAGKEARGAGTLAATIDIELHDAAEDGTLLRATLDLTATGRGESVSDAAWGQAAEALLAGVVRALNDVAASNGQPAAASANGVAPQPAPTVRPVPVIEPPSRPLGAAPPIAPAGSPIKRLAAATGLVLLVLVVLRWHRRRR